MVATDLLREGSVGSQRLVAPTGFPLNPQSDIGSGTGLGILQPGFAFLNDELIILPLLVIEADQPEPDRPVAE